MWGNSAGQFEGGGAAAGGAELARALINAEGGEAIGWRGFFLAYDEGAAGAA